MWPYWMFFIVSCLFCLIDFFEIKREDKFLLISSQIVLMTLFSGLRFDCDFDYKQYVEIYDNMPNFVEWYETLNNASKKQTYGEPLFVALCILLKTLHAPAVVLFFVIAALTFLLIGMFIWRASTYPFTTLFLYNSLFFLAGGFTQIRFGLANAIVLHAFWALYNKNVKTYLLLLLIGAGFHVTSLIGILVLPFYYLPKNKKVYIVLAIIGLVVSFMDLNYLIINYFFNIEAESSYGYYLAEMEYLTKAPNTTLIIYMGLLLIYFIIEKQQLGIEKTKREMLFAVAVICFLVGGIAIQVNILTRFTVLLQIVFIILIPYLLYYFKYKPIAFLLILLYCLFKFNQFLQPGSFILPYQNIIFI